MHSERRDFLPAWLPSLRGAVLGLGFLGLGFLGILVLGPTAVLAQTPDAPAAEAGEADEGEAPPAQARQRITFNVELSDGGRATGSAGDSEFQRDDYFLATGGVEVKYKGLELKADRVRIEIPTNLLTAEGNVILDDGPERLAGDTLEYDLTKRTGKLTQASAFVQPEFYFSGDHIAKVGEGRFTVDDGVFTSCSQEVPSWSIHMSGARITIEEYARIKNAKLKLGKVPIFYVPYIVWPATTDRASGLLVPKPGSSKRRGAELSLAYFQTLGRSADTTFLVDLSSKEYFGFGNEFRYRPSERTEGVFRAYMLSEPDDALISDNPFDPDRQPGDTRWKVEYDHETRDLWGGFRGVVSLRDYSDFDYLQDFERDADSQRRSFIYSNAYLSRNFGQQSLNVMVDQRERILGGGREDLRRQLPEIEYKLRPTKLGGTPLYLSLDSAMHFISLDLSQASGDFSDEYGRIHFAPTLSLPVSTAPWLSAKLDLSGQATFYSASVDPDADPDDPDVDPTQFAGGSLSRFIPQAELEIIGPSFSRIFDKKNGKLKHIIEPRISYAFVDDFNDVFNDEGRLVSSDQNKIFLFDEIDRLRPANSFFFSLINRFMAKRGEDSAVEVASIALSQVLSLDDDRPGQISRDRTLESSSGPLLLTARLNPTQDTSVKADLSYNTLFNELQSLRFTGSTRVGKHDFGLSWFTNFNPEFDPELQAESRTSDQLRFSTGLSLIPDKFSLRAQLSFDVLGPVINSAGDRDAWDLLQQRYFFDWKGQCISWQLEFRESTFRDIEDRDVRFSLTLKHVGTFLDLNDSF